jgi:hypothetical protein
MQKWRAGTALAGALAAVLTMTTAGPASADTASFTDPAGDAHRGVDIRTVRVVHEDRIVVRTTFDYLNRRAARGLAVYFDTDQANRGPEYAAVGGLNDSSDWQAIRIGRWNDRTPQLLMRCDIDLRLRFGPAGKATFDVARTRSCFGRPDAIRVAARASGPSSQDWAPGRKRFFPGTVEHG